VPKCSQSGYKGRTGIHELLVARRKFVVRLSGVNRGEIGRLAMAQGMRTLHQDGIFKIFKVI
jgi:type II secretory ATPase GspE/PulE/Tfp pilus assembly ATPase PilB-like protein